MIIKKINNTTSALKTKTVSNVKKQFQTLSRQRTGLEKDKALI